jgi:hypothetical protein
MMDLIERAPDGWVLVEAAGEPPAIHFYYGVRPADTGKLAIGARFGVVYSPNRYVHPASPLRPWCYVVFEVNLYQFRETRGLERAYQQVKRRQLTRFEVAHFEERWTEIVMMGRRG